MSMYEWYKGIAIVASLGQTLFVVLYATFPWYRSFLGRALFIKGLTLTLLLDTALAGVLWDWSHEDVWVVTLYGFMAFGIWAQLIAFLVHRFGNIDQDSTEKKRKYHSGT